MAMQGLKKIKQITMNLPWTFINLNSYINSILSNTIIFFETKRQADKSNTFIRANKVVFLNKNEVDCFWNCFHAGWHAIIVYPSIWHTSHDNKFKTTSKQNNKNLKWQLVGQIMEIRIKFAELALCRTKMIIVSCRKYLSFYRGYNSGPTIAM